MKYHNKKTIVDGQLFDSKKEAQRWRELAILESCGVIEGLKRQTEYLLIPSQKGQTRTERPVKYVADFEYIDGNGEKIVEDAKGLRTRDYVLKRKLMLFIHGIEVREV